MYPENSGQRQAGVRQPGVPARDDHPAQRQDDHDQRAGRVADQVLRADPEVERAPVQQAVRAVLDARAAVRRSTGQLGHRPTTGAAPGGAPPSYGQGTEPAVGFVSAAADRGRAGRSTTVDPRRAERDGLARRPCRRRATAPSGLEGQPAVARRSAWRRPARRDGQPHRLRNSANAKQTFYTVPITLTRRTGQTLPSITLTVLVAQPGSLLGRSTTAASPTTATSTARTSTAAAGATRLRRCAAQGVHAGQHGHGRRRSTSPGRRRSRASPTTRSRRASRSRSTHLPAPSRSGSSARRPTDRARAWRRCTTPTARPRSTGSVSPTGRSAAARAAVLRQRRRGHARPTATAITARAAGQRRHVPVQRGPAGRPDQDAAVGDAAERSHQGQLHVFSIGTSTAAQTGPVVTSVQPDTASAGRRRTINGSGFGATQGSRLRPLHGQRHVLGCARRRPRCRSTAGATRAITFTVPTAANGAHVFPGSTAMVTVVTGAGQTSDTAALDITPTANPADYYDNVGYTTRRQPGLRQLRRPRLQLLGQDPGGRRFHAGRHGDRRRPEVHVAERVGVRVRQHPRVAGHQLASAEPVASSLHAFAGAATPA